ncbi:MAG: carbonic anhydrase family protein [Rhodospirillales bacterium]|nr:carbonic anhydrase family protein [Rhodospirillales bacterium]
MHRRSVLKGVAMGLMSVCPVCAALTRAAAGEGHGPHWDYEGDAGPMLWGDLEPAFKACALGTQQSPIDIGAAIPAELGSLDIAWKPIPLRIINNGHTIQVNCEPGSTAHIAGKSYALAQFHFHHPSEHLLVGNHFEMEAHFVHLSAEREIAVVGAFIRAGSENKALAPVFDAMPESAGPEQVVAGVVVTPEDVLPQDRTYFRYFGSLTTPPCSEGVLWTVLRDPIEASAEQIGRFATLFPMDARPTQSLNNRFVLQNI